MAERRDGKGRMGKRNIGQVLDMLSDLSCTPLAIRSLLYGCGSTWIPQQSREAFVVRLPIHTRGTYPPYPPPSGLRHRAYSYIRQTEGSASRFRSGIEVRRTVYREAGPKKSYTTGCAIFDRQRARREQGVIGQNQPHRRKWRDFGGLLRSRWTIGLTTSSRKANIIRATGQSIFCCCG